MKISKQALRLDGLRFYAYHGVDPQETVVGAWYNVSIEMEVKNAASLDTDNLADTLNYAAATRLIKEQMQIPSKLIEHLTGRIAKALLNGITGLEKVTVTVAKLNPPVAVPCESASFTLNAEKN